MTDTKTPLEWIELGARYGAPMGIHAAVSTQADDLPEGYHREYHAAELWRLQNYAFGDGFAPSSTTVRVWCHLISENSGNPADDCECDGTDKCDPCLAHEEATEDVSVFRDIGMERIELDTEAPDLDAAMQIAQEWDRFPLARHTGVLIATPWVTVVNYVLSEGAR